MKILGRSFLPLHSVNYKRFEVGGGGGRGGERGMSLVIHERDFNINLSVTVKLKSENI